MPLWEAPTDYRSRPVAVLGGGILGRRIASPPLPTAQPAPTLGHLTTHPTLADAVASAWLVIESIPESLPLKTATFAALENHASPDAILASNSSSHKSSEFLTQVRHAATKARICNSHYYMPPQVMLVELMTSGHTDQADLLAFLAQRQREAGMTPVVARRESTGFVWNRIWAATKREVMMVLAEGVATPEELDGVFAMMFGVPREMGPCRMMDVVGLDTVVRIEEHYVAERGLGSGHVEWLRRHYVEEGRLGVKSEKGGLYPPVEQTYLG